MLDEQELKQRLQEIAANNYHLPTGIEVLPLAYAMGTYLGSTDPELRDDLIYTTLAIWIQRGVFDAEALDELLKVAMNNEHLFLGLGEQGTDTVFMRAFSVLLVAPIIEAHRRHAMLGYAELQLIRQRVLRYLAGERDLRGYVAQKGWAHAVAHTADVLDELVQCPEFDWADVVEILEAIRAKMMATEAAYVFEEDERMVTAVLHAWQRSDAEETAVLEWLAGFTPPDSDLALPERHYRLINSKNFLRSLYFRAQDAPVATAVQQAIVEALAPFHRFATPKSS